MDYVVIRLMCDIILNLISTHIYLMVEKSLWVFLMRGSSRESVVVVVGTKESFVVRLLLKPVAARE